MKVVIAHRSGSVQVVDLPEPNLARGCVAVKVTHSALQLPDELDQLRSVSQMKGKDDGFPLGSGVSGVIDAVGADVRRMRVGLRIAAYGPPYVYHSERLVIPENLVVEIPKKVNHEEGAFVGQGATAVNTFRAGKLGLGEVGLVFGADLPGVLLTQVLRAGGVTPVLIDPSEHRLTKARNIGITHALRPDQAEDLLRLVDTLTEGHGADGAFLTRGGDALAFRAAAELVRVGGTIVVGARIAGTEFPPTIEERSIRIVTASAPGPGRRDPNFERQGIDYPRHLVRWNERTNMDCFCALLNERKVQISPLVTDRVPIDRAASIYEKLGRSADLLTAAVLTI
jgi:NADPH:quinone reductase-like Zn-dependent oxidoreductase